MNITELKQFADEHDMSLTEDDLYEVLVRAAQQTTKTSNAIGKFKTAIGARAGRANSQADFLAAFTSRRLNPGLPPPVATRTKSELRERAQFWAMFTSKHLNGGGQ